MNKNMKNYINNRYFDLERLRKVDFTRFLTTSIREITGKKVTLCPFHEEKTASFFIYPNNSYYCFGCGAHGNGAIDFLIKRFNYSFKDACNILEAL